KASAFLLVALSSAFFFQGCKSERRVEASGEETPSGRTETYASLSRSRIHPSNQPIWGELGRVDIANQMFVVRLENGIEQTFRFKGPPTVTGAPNLAPEPQGREKPSPNPQISKLVGREGSELSVQWTPEGSDKIATSVDVLQLTTAKKKPKRR